MTDLRSTIESLATQFAASLFDALRGASIDELVAVSQGGRRSGRARGERDVADLVGGRRKGRGGRLGRRSADDIGKMIDGIVSLLQKSDGGLRAEQIREALGVEAKELPRPLAEAVSLGRITKSGQKRATTYFVGSGDATASPKKRARRAAGRKKR